jgi:hypothetical protein
LQSIETIQHQRPNKTKSEKKTSSIPSSYNQPNKQNNKIRKKLVHLQLLKAFTFVLFMLPSSQPKYTMYTFLPQHHPLQNTKEQKENCVKNYNENQ